MRNIRLGVGALIPGVDEALQGMRVGGERTAIVPPQLGYGDGVVMVFRIELSSVQ
jgi:FKBP-type peptidyl-prolyl cis-trans isomerase